jgi:hypothetical protein
MDDEISVTVSRAEVRKILHDLNNVLAALGGSASYLSPRVAADEALARRVEQIQKCVTRLSEISQALDRLAV